MPPVTPALPPPAVRADDLAAGADPARAAFALRVDRAGWPVLDDRAWRAAPLALELAPEGLTLVGRGPGLAGRARVDLVSGPLGARLRRGVRTDEPLARAVGARAGRRPEVLDLTLGWARDSAVLATLGCRVRAWERSPVLAALLDDGLRRAAAEPRLAPALARLTWQEGDARDHLQEHLNGESLDRDAPAGGARVLLMDPMFPARDASALVRLPLRLAGAVVGADDDAAALFEAAWAARPERLVVRRPRGAPPVTDARPVDLVVPGGRTTRFDVYFPSASAG